MDKTVLFVLLVGVVLLLVAMRQVSRFRQQQAEQIARLEVQLASRQQEVTRVQGDHAALQMRFEATQFDLQQSTLQLERQRTELDQQSSLIPDLKRQLTETWRQINNFQSESADQKVRIVSAARPILPTSAR